MWNISVRLVVEWLVVWILIWLFFYVVYCVFEKDIGLLRLIVGVFLGVGFIVYEFFFIVVYFFILGKWILVLRK